MKRCFSVLNDVYDVLQYTQALAFYPKGWLYTYCRGSECSDFWLFMCPGMGFHSTPCLTGLGETNKKWKSFMMTSFLSCCHSFTPQGEHLPLWAHNLSKLHQRPGYWPLPNSRSLCVLSRHFIMNILSRHFIMQSRHFIMLLLTITSRYWF